MVISLLYRLEKDDNENALGYVSLASTVPGVKSVQRVPLIDDGNYRGTPTVQIFKPKQGNRATGTVTIAEGGIDSVTLTIVDLIILVFLLYHLLHQI